MGLEMYVSRGDAPTRYPSLCVGLYLNGSAIDITDSAQMHHNVHGRSRHLATIIADVDSSKETN